MKKKEINLKNIKKSDIDLIVDYISREKVVVYPTDTVYGLGCIATSKKAINKVFRIKKIKQNKPLIVLMSSFSMVKKYCYISSDQGLYLNKIWPGPITVILKSKEGIPKKILDKDGGIAVRLPKDKFLTTILKRVSNPLISTSLNITGKKVLNSIKYIEEYFKLENPDLVIDGGIIKRTKSSKIIDLREIDKIKVLRK